MLGTKNEKENENLWFSIFFRNTVLKTTDIQVLKNSTFAPQDNEAWWWSLTTKTISKNFQ